MYFKIKTNLTSVNQILAIHLQSLSVMLWTDNLKTQGLPPTGLFYFVQKKSLRFGRDNNIFIASF